MAARTGGAVVCATAPGDGDDAGVSPRQVSLTDMHFNESFAHRVPAGSASSALELELQEAESEAHGRRHARRQRIGAVAGVALLLVVCAGIGVAIYLSSSSSKSVRLPAKFSGSFTTTDRFNPDLVYTGRVHKSTNAAGRTVLEATMSHVDPWTKERVVATVKDHRVYMQFFNDSISTTVPVRVTCMPPNLVPPMGDMDALFNLAVEAPATALDASNTGLQQCIDAGDRWLLRWGVQEFVYCRPHNNVHAVVGDNFATTFVADSVTSPLGTTIPTNVTTGTAAVCEEIKEVSALTHKLGHTHSWTPVRRVTALPPGRRLVAARPCLFLGGAGYETDGSSLASQDENGYWGPYIQSSLNSQCSSFTFMRRDMKRKGWDDLSHASAFCDEAVAVATGSSGTTIGEVVIFTHGAGSLVVGAALAANTCSFSSSTRWYSAMAPFEGSKASDEGLTLCAQFSALEDILVELKMCKGNNNNQLHNGILAQQSTYTSATTTLAEARTQARNNLDGAMCGHDSSGLYTGVGVGLYQMDLYIWFGESRDGFMGLSQCTTVHTSSWQDHNTDQWANIHINYLDGTCRFGDACYDPYNDHSPCSWYAAMAART